MLNEVCFMWSWTFQSWKSGVGHVNWVPCHCGKARPPVADSENSLQIWRVNCEYVEQIVAYNRQGVVLMLEVCAPELRTLHLKRQNLMRGTVCET